MKRAMLIPLLFVPLHSAAQPDLTGLWCAKLRFGPDVRGTLTIDQRGAEIAGRSASVRRDGNAISFELRTSLRFAILVSTI